MNETFTDSLLTEEIALKSYRAEQKQGDTCLLCDDGTPCVVRIMKDVSDVQSDIAALGEIVSQLDIFFWLRDHYYSTLTHSTVQLADMYVEEFA